MKMAKKVREYKAGDFIFAKVKGYPAWPARVQRQNGKKYFVYFYGTAETANLPPNMIFDYAENKDKFLTKTVKRRDFNDGVKQIEYDFANNVPLEQVIGVSATGEAQNESEMQEDDSVIDTTADETMADESTANATQNDSIVEDSDDTGLVIDEVKAKGKKSTAKAKETPRKEPRTPKTKKNEKEEEITSRSGRKIRPKRYIDEHTEDNSTVPSVKKRPPSPTLEKDKFSKDCYHITPQSDLEDLKEPFTDEADKENILIAYLPSGRYVGIRLFQSRPHNFKNEGARLKWDKQEAMNAITLKIQLESGQITAQSVASQLLMDLSLTDEEKDKLDKEREIDERKSRLQFLKTEVKMLELDAKIKTCLCLEKADTETCLKLLDELMELDIKPLMLLKHPSCLETVKRMRAYVGNTSSWGFSEAAAIAFGQDAHRIRKQADAIYTNMKKLFPSSEAISFFEYFTEKVAVFKKITAKMAPEDIMEMVHEPIEMSQPMHTMKLSVSANDNETSFDGNKSKNTGKAKKITNTPSKTPVKRQNTKKQDKPVEETEKEKEDKNKEPEKAVNQEANTENIETQDTEATQMDTDKDEQTNETNENENNDKDKEIMDKDNGKDKINEKDDTTNESVNKDNEPKNKINEPKDKVNELKDKNNESKDKINEPKDKINESKGKNNETKDKDNDKINETDKEKSEKRKLSTESKSSNNDEIKESDNSDEPKAKRTRETKKTEPVPRSPAKRKTKV